MISHEIRATTYQRAKRNRTRTDILKNESNRTQTDFLKVQSNRTELEPDDLGLVRVCGSSEF